VKWTSLCHVYTCQKIFTWAHPFVGVRPGIGSTKVGPLPNTPPARVREVSGKKA